MTSNQGEGMASYASEQGALTHVVNVTRLPSKGLNIVIEPDEEVRKKLADQCDVLFISEFSAKLNVKSWHRDGVRVSGLLSAALTQSCIVTLEPVPEQIDTQIDAVFVPSTSKLAKPNINAETRELIVEAEGNDVPEVFDLPDLDVGAVAAEFFALELNPYPKSPNADELADAAVQQDAVNESDARENPFASLAKIRDKL